MAVDTSRVSGAESRSRAGALSEDQVVCAVAGFLPGPQARIAALSHSVSLCVYTRPYCLCLRGDSCFIPLSSSSGFLGLTSR